MPLNFRNVVLNTTIDPGSLNKAYLILNVFNHTLRQEIIQIISENPMIREAEVLCKLPIEPSLISTHLKILCKWEIVIKKREAGVLYYTVNHSKIGIIERYVEMLCISGNSN